jgi:hypothetical protein
MDRKLFIEKFGSEYNNLVWVLTQELGFNTYIRARGN